MNHYLHFNLDTVNYSVTLTEIHHPMHCMYLAEFDDEYENIFYSDPRTGKWIEQDIGFSALANKIREQLEKRNTPTRLAPKNILWHHQFERGKWLHFGYYPTIIDECLTYEIYASNHRFMFNLVKTGIDDWCVMEMPGSTWDFNDAYAERILYAVEQLYQNSI